MIALGKKYMMLLLVCVALASCTSDDSIDIPSPEYTPIVVLGNDEAEVTQLSMSQNHVKSETVETSGVRGYGHQVYMSGYGNYEVAYTIYPIYAFKESPSPGDYYLVEAEVRVFGTNMWNGVKESYYTKMTEYGERKYAYNLWGFYLNGVQLKSQLLDKNGNEVAIFPVDGLPTPSTTMESTSYTTGFQCGIKGSLRIEYNTEVGILVKGKILPYINIINKQNRNTALIDVYNNSTNHAVDIRYKYTEPNEDVANPPLECTTTKTFHQSWIWRVPNTEEFSTEHFKMRYQCNVVYGDHWGDETPGDRGLGFNETLTTFQSPVTEFDITPPERIPMGQLTISNRNQNEYVSNIVVCKHGSADTVAVSGQSSYSAGNSFIATLDEGDYDITFKRGKRHNDMKKFTLALDKATVLRDQNITLYSDFHFEEE